MPRARGKAPRLPAELQDHIEDAGGEEMLGEGWMKAYRHALNHGNVHKGCVLYADAHHEDFAVGGMYGPKDGDDPEDDSADDATDDD